MTKWYSVIDYHTARVFYRFASLVQCAKMVAKLNREYNDKTRFGVYITYTH